MNQKEESLSFMGVHHGQWVKRMSRIQPTEESHSNFPGFNFNITVRIKNVDLHK